ncbi:hypothetical protein D3C73_1392070 [compost metagenome]
MPVLTPGNAGQCAGQVCSSHLEARLPGVCGKAWTFFVGLPRLVHRSADLGVLHLYLKQTGHMGDHGAAILYLSSVCRVFADRSLALQADQDLP